MEDFQEQEYEFLRRLEEERSDRRTLLRRGVGAGVGLTILSLSPAALAARKQATAEAPGRGKGTTIKEFVAEAKKEGRLNTIALPPDWANYGEIMRTFTPSTALKSLPATPGVWRKLSPTTQTMTWPGVASTSANRSSSCVMSAKWSVRSIVKETLTSEVLTMSTGVS